MANADMTRLMDNCRVHLPGALDSAIQRELFSVLNDFFQDSNIWYEDITFTANPTDDTIFSNPDAFTYDLDPPSSGGTPVRLLGVWNSQGVPQSATMATPGTVVLQYAPNVSDTYTARIALTVTDPVTKEGYPVFPAWILNKYNNDILDGVLARMMGQPAKPYSNPQMAMYHARKFRGAISTAKVEAQHQNVYRGQAWRFPQTFARRRYFKF